MTKSTNPREVIGANNPPLTPFEAAKKRIDDLYTECGHWLDGAVVKDEATAEVIGSLLNLIREAEKEADAARVAENVPFDTGKAEVQARYAELIGNTKTMKGKTVKAAEACKAALVPWLQQKEAERQAEAKRLRDEAEEKERLAQEAIRDADRSNLEQMEAAETLIAEANKAGAVAKRVENATVTVSNQAGRAIGLRTTWVAEVTSAKLFGEYVWQHCKPDYIEFLNVMAKRLVDGGKREIVGLKITEEKRAA